jgi:hypothetical protein
MKLKEINCIALTKKYLSGLFLFIAFYSQSLFIHAQVSYGSSAIYGLRKLNPSYTGSAIQVRRTCDNATFDIGFNSCGGLDTVELKKFVIASNPLSAITATSATAYSLRKLSCSYFGNAIQVRRSSDNAVQDIGFTSLGDLDTISLKTFIGANSGFIAIWYDQSSNGRNASQANTARQPRIVNAGVIERQNTKPAIYFGGLTRGLFTGNFSGYATAACFNGVAKVNTNLTYNTIVNKTNNNNFPCPIDFYNGSILSGNGIAGQYNSFGASQTFNAAKPLGIWTYQANGTTASGVNAYYNSAQILTNQTSTYYADAAGAGLYIGSRFDGVTGLNGWIAEIVTFGSIPSATDRSFLEWSQGQYYNVSSITLGTLPAGAANGFIATLYDQSGSGQHATQATPANQPNIINVGVTRVQNGLPIVYLDGTNYYLSNATINIANPYTANTVATRTANGGFAGYQRLLNMSATGDSYGYLGALSGNYATFTGNGAGTWNDIAANTANTAVTLNSKAVLSMAASTGATGLVPYINGVTQSSKVGTAAAATGILIGAPYNVNNTNQLWTGNVSEVTIFPTALSTTRRRLLEANEAAYHAITISNNKYTPPTATTCILFVNGVGRESTSDSVSTTRSSSGMGFSIGQAAGDFLKDDGDYLTIGMSCPVIANISTSNLPGTVVQRWANEWYLNKTDVNSNDGNVTIYFDFSEYGVTGAPGTASNYVLLARNSPAGTFAIVSGTTVSVSGDRVSFSVNTSNIPTANYYTIGTINSSSSPLPVELVSFEGNVCENNVCLNWETASETNNSYFSVERSLDASDFEEVGKVNSLALNGNSYQTLNYSFVDYKPHNGLSYYRLTQFDINGQSKKSGLITVKFDEVKKISFVIYPNPNKGEFTVDFSGIENNHEITVSIINIQGKQVYQTSIDMENLGTNSFKIIPQEKIVSGIYMIAFEIEGVKYISKVIVE